jgi:hypothetical protein
MSLLLLGVALFAWPAMMFVHELGHIVAAWLTDGNVTRLVWHPLVFSRTDVTPNPSPLVVVWAGPIIGCLLPLVLERATAVAVPSILYIVRLFTGFCLIANGAYIGLGGFDGVGDAGVMIQTGTPLWVMIAFGVVACGLGIWFWHLASYRLGSGKRAALPVPWSHATSAFAAGMLLNAIAFAVGDRGI